MCGRLLPDARFSVEEATAEGDKVVVRWQLRGTWTKDFAGNKATGKELNLTGMSMYSGFVGDKIKSRRKRRDGLR